MPYRFAVDLGTSNTVAVVDRGDGSPRPLLFDGSPVLPSAVFADASGALLVGRDAERHLMTDAARFEPNPKGRVDEGHILLGDREVPVAELLAAVLRRAATEAAQTGVSVTDATVLTCPVDWGNTRRAVLLEAAARAGLGRVTLLDEPVSAARYCVQALGGRLAPGRCAVVFDFGGGTLDVTVIEAGRGTDPASAPPLRVLATGGLADLGGTDVDAALVGHLGHLVAAADPDLWRRLSQPRTPSELRDRRTFWSEVRLAKEMLSRAASAPVHLPGSDHATHLTRDELDRIAGPLVDRAVDETRRVLERSGATPRTLDAIVLVGGSSRLPLVASRLHARFGLAPVVPEQPELPVAFGALLVAGDTVAPPSPAADRTSTGGVYGPPPSGYQPVPAAAPVSAYPAAPVSPYAGGYPVSQPEPAPPPRPQRPSVIIGPGVTLQGNVAVYGDAGLMPRDDDDDDEPATPSARDDRERRRGRRPFGLFWRLRMGALPLLPLVIIMIVTPWGRAAFHDGTAAVQGWFGATATPAPSAAGPAAASTQPDTRAKTTSAAPSGTTAEATLQLTPTSGRAGSSVKVAARNFKPNESIEVRGNNKALATLTADGRGAINQNMTVAASGDKVGAPILVTFLGKTSGRSARATFTVVAG